MDTIIQNKWFNLAHISGLTHHEAQDIFRDLEIRYSEPHRAYHNLKHIEQMLDAANQNNIHNPSILLAIWFHDVIYHPSRNGNERRSARLLHKVLHKTRVKKDMLSEASRLILLTERHITKEADINGRCLLDLDLLVLGSNRAEYIEYARKIRKEYHMFPDVLFKNGRRKVLNHFLAKDNIYHTKPFENLEIIARRNLQHELQDLL